MDEELLLMYLQTEYYLGDNRPDDPAAGYYVLPGP